LRDKNRKFPSEWDLEGTQTYSSNQSITDGGLTLMRYFQLDHSPENQYSETKTRNVSVIITRPLARRLLII
jgi:hypothetical protein